MVASLALPCSACCTRSYIHGFYVKDPTYKALFEDSQGLLIGNLEKLHSLLETHTIEAVLTGPPAARGKPAAAASAGAGAAGSGAPSAPSLLPHDQLAASTDAWRQQVIGLMTATTGFLGRFLEAVQHGFMAAGAGLRRSGSHGSAGPRVRRHKSGESSSSESPRGASASVTGTAAAAAGAAGTAGSR